MLARLQHGLVAFFTLISAGSASAIMDLNGNRVSDLWEMEHAINEFGTVDSDGDGFSNVEEGIAGTDPGDRESFLKVKKLFLSEGEVTLRWDGVAGKTYQVQLFDSASQLWEDLLTVLPDLVDGEREISVTRVSKGIYRVVASDVDLDSDGLSGWEEARLGWSDENSRSSGIEDRLDYSAAIHRIEDPDGVQFAGEELMSPRSPSRDEAVRFLIQASFGPNEESILAVQNLGFSRWIENQMDLPPSRMTSYLFANGSNISSDMMRQAWWRLANIAEDQLAQRVAYAWSQIFVVGFEGSSLVNDNAATQSRYYDIFVREGLNNYRDILEDVTYSMVMGNYLSHLNNRKSDPSIDRFPDENFAREIMQLFSIGLWELNEDGSRKLVDGELVPTYNNETITEMAKVFTGMSNSRTNNGQVAWSFSNTARGNDYWFPMKVWEDEHEPGPKTIIGGIVLDGTQTGEEEVQATLDALVDHPNVAPFISRLLIQRLTCSNPSTEYMSRVTSAWLGQEIDAPDQLEHVITAILLDPEVRNIDPTDEYRGKVREPLLRYIQLFRAFDFRDPSGKFRTDSSGLKNSLGQFPTLAPSVFNFYLPDYLPPGEMREEGLASPELQIATMSQMLNSDNLSHSAINRGATFMVPDYTDELAIAGDAGALLDHLDSLLTGRSLKPETKAVILDVIEGIGEPETRVKAAVQLLTQSMEYTVIK